MTLEGAVWWSDGAEAKLEKGKEEGETGRLRLGQNCYGASFQEVWPPRAAERRGCMFLRWESRE